MILRHLKKKKAPLTFLCSLIDSCECDVTINLQRNGTT